MLDNQNNRQSHLITVRGLSKSFSNNGIRIEILKSINFDLDAGETISIVGASGIGKSTLLHILGTLDRPDSGTFLFQDKDVFLFDDEKLARFRNESIGFVFQFHHLLPEFSAVENTMMPALIKGVSKKEARESAETILVRVGLQGLWF
jgi:lipoprotein-releasing system ATP-binding protein